MTPSQKNEKALAALKNLKTALQFYPTNIWGRFDELEQAIAALSQPTTGETGERAMVQIGFFEKTGYGEEDFDLRHFHDGMNDVPDRWVAAYADRKYWDDFLKEKPYSTSKLHNPRQVGGQVVRLRRQLEIAVDCLKKPEGTSHGLLTLKQTREAIQSIQALENGKLDKNPV